MQEPNIYARLYDVVAENLEHAGKTFGYEKDTFLCDVEGHPRALVVSKYTHLCNEEFFQAVFVGAFKRLPEEKELSPWLDKMNLPEKCFQEQVLRMIEGSSVTAINQMEIVDNPYFEQKKDLKYHLLGKLYGLTDKSSLREFGKRLPEPIQKIIRKVFL